MLIIKKGDVLKAFENNEVDVIAHGCNCFNTFGSGIAFSISNKYPDVYAEDFRTMKGSRDKLGTIMPVPIDGKYIVNCYTQYSFGRDKRHVDYYAFRCCMTKLKEFVLENNLILGIPRIGAGLGGGDWAILEDTILDIFKDIDVFVYVV